MQSGFSDATQLKPFSVSSGNVWWSEIAANVNGESEDGTVNDAFLCPLIL